MRYTPTTPFKNRTLSNEKQLQEFIEDEVLPAWGWQRISSSLKGRGRLGKIDTTALAPDGTPVLIEYKFDLVDAETFSQIAGYETWLRKPQNFARFEERCHGPRVRWDHLELVTIGPRYSATLPRIESKITCWRVERGQDRLLRLRRVRPGLLTRADVDGRFVPDSKDCYLPQHLDATSGSARTGFNRLDTWLHTQPEVSRTVAGKMGTAGVTYSRGGVRFMKVQFTDGGLALTFKGQLARPVGNRVTSSGDPRWPWQSSIAGAKDVDGTIRVLTEALDSLQPTSRRRTTR